MSECGLIVTLKLVIQLREQFTLS